MAGPTLPITICGQEFELDADGFELIAHYLRMGTDDREWILKFAQKVVDDERRRAIFKVIEGSHQSEDGDD